MEESDLPRSMFDVPGRRPARSDDRARPGEPSSQRLGDLWIESRPQPNVSDLGRAFFTIDDHGTVVPTRRRDRD
ncbi:MAG: hypothetical protein ACE37K_18635 [Planctomycetota bacterium]